MLLGSSTAIQTGAGNSEGSDSLTLDLIPISEGAFLSAKRDYNSGLVYDSSIVVKGGEAFTLEVAGQSKSFSCPRDYRGCYYYKGFLKGVKSYVITQCGDVCVTYLLDRTSGQLTPILQCFDNGAEVPVISKNGDKALVFSYSVFDAESCMALYPIHDSAPRIREQEGQPFKLLAFRIAEVVWIDQSSIAIRSFMKTEQRKLSNGQFEDVQVGVKYWKVRLTE